MMKKSVFLILFIILLFSFSFADIPIKFFKEEVNIELKESSITVQGLYFFENRSSFAIDVKMNYPFPIDSAHPYPEKIKVSVSDNPLKFVKKGESINWTLHFYPNQVETVYVKYKQKIKEKTASYILTTTKLWKGKIDKAVFIIKAPRDFKELNISIKPDSVISKKTRRFYYITKRYFLPEKDLKISW